MKVFKQYTFGCSQGKKIEAKIIQIGLLMFCKLTIYSFV